MVRNLNQSSIPKEWKYDYLDKFSARGSGHTPDKEKSEYWNGGIKWVSLSDSSKLDNGYIYFTDKEISEEGLKNSSAVLHPKETVILSRDAGVGKSAVIAEAMAVSQHFMAWRCDNTEKLHSWFLYNWLQILKPEFERQAVGSTIKTIGLGYFKRLKIAVPPFSEQNKIAEILSTWDKSISVTEQFLTNSQQQKKALMQNLLTGKKRLQGFTGDWKEYRLEKICTFMRGKGLSKDLLTPNGKYKCILYGELFTKYDEVIKNVMSRTDSAESVKSVSGDILLPSSTTTSGIDLANATALLEDDVLLSGDINILRPNKKLACSIFLAYLLTHVKKREILARAQGITIVHLYGSDLKPIKASLPSLEEQQQIASILLGTDQEIEKIKQQLSFLKQEKNALMQQLLTGKRRVAI